LPTSIFCAILESLQIGEFKPEGIMADEPEVMTEAPPETAEVAVETSTDEAPAAQATQEAAPEAAE
jgi:hypothetical protein